MPNEITIPPVISNGDSGTLFFLLLYWSADVPGSSTADMVIAEPAVNVTRVFHRANSRRW